MKSNCKYKIQIHEGVQVLALKKQTHKFSKILLLLNLISFSSYNNRNLIYSFVFNNKYQLDIDRMSDVNFLFVTHQTIKSFNWHVCFVTTQTRAAQCTSLNLFANITKPKGVFLTLHHWSTQVSELVVEFSFWQRSL